MAISTKNTGVKTQHKQYDEFYPKWKRCRDVMKGKDAVHAAGTEYLPALLEQEPAEYAAYVKRAGFYNASWRTVAGFKGMLFRKPPNKVIPKGIEEHLKNVNLKGDSIEQLVEDGACEILEVGRFGLLVDYPNKPAGKGQVTVAQVEKLNLRPTIQMYFAENIINWRYTTINNATVLALVVLSEVKEVQENEFEVKEKTVYRVLDLEPTSLTYRIRIFDVSDTGVQTQIGDDITPTKNGKPMTEIPFVFVSGDGTTGKVYDPPLIDLVDKNLDHYVVSADYEHGCHFTALPTAWVAGFNNKGDGTGQKLYVGSQTAWVFESPEAKAGYLEFTGTGLKALKENLDGKKQEMATLGARMLADASERQVETFGATAIKHLGENSILAAISINLSKGIEKALTWFADWAGQTGEIKYEVNRKFMPVQMDAPTLTSLMGAWQGGAISQQDFFILLQEGEIVAAEKTFEEHQAEIDNQQPIMAEPTEEPKPKEDIEE